MPVIKLLIIDLEAAEADTPKQVSRQPLIVVF